MLKHIPQRQATHTTTNLRPSVSHIPVAENQLAHTTVPLQQNRAHAAPITHPTARTIRRAELLQLQHTHGNAFVARQLAQRDPNDSAGNFQLRPPQLRLPRSPGSSFGVGQLQLDLSPFQQLAVPDTFSPSRLFQPSPELLQQLVDNWLMQYKLTHPGPAPAEREWQQLWSSWRRLTDQWIARGADAPLNAQLAQDLLRDQAAQAVLNLQPASGDVSLADIAGKVWPAFQKALDATQFYPKLKQNAEQLLQQHWPILIPTLGTALGTSLGMGLHSNDWRGMQQLSNFLPMLNKDLRLNDNWSLTLGFTESKPIRGSGEQGVVIGANPMIGFKYKSGNIQFSLEGSINIRFETGQDSTRGVQVNASPGAQATFRW